MPAPLRTGADDPDVVLPPAVRASMAKAAAAHEAAYPKPQAPDAPTPQPAPVAVVEPTPAPSPAPAPVEPEPPVVNPPPVDWEHRYNSMKGRHDRAVAQTNQLSEKMANLERLVATLQKPTTPTELTPESLLTPKEVEDYGEEFLAVVGKRAKQEFQSTINALQSKITSLESQLGATTESVHATGRTNLEAFMDSKLPGWEEINTDDDFLHWLGLPDPYSGGIRHDLLRSAHEALDAPRVLNFFRGFLSERAATAPALPAEPVPTPQVAKVPLEQFAAPGRAKTAAPNPVPAEKPLISRAFIARFYADCAANRYRGRDQERTDVEKSIFLAEREGRIVN